MAGERAAIRYAKATLSFALTEKSANKVNDDMRAIAKVIAENLDLGNMLTNSVIKAETKKETLVAILPNLNTISVGLLDVLIANKRLDILNAVANSYIMLFDAHEGKEQATVITAVPLTKALEDKVLTKVKALTNKTVTLKRIVDESIIGGFILRVGDKQYDASIANKLNTLKRQFILN